MDQRILTAFILFDASVIVLIFAHLIGWRKQISLIAGLDVARVRDIHGLARWVGKGLLGIGLLDMLLSLVMFIPYFDPTMLVIAYVGVSLGGAAVLVIGTRRYMA